MTTDIALVLLLLVGTFIVFVREKVPADLTAIGLLVTLVATGILPLADAFSVFGNPAPLTIGAMFVLSAALVKCGAIDRVSALVTRAATLPYPVVVLILTLLVAAMSAFINNTPVVVVFLPVVLTLARRMQLAASKLLIPLSYAAVLGGACTLIGTSTNLVVNGIMVGRGQPSLSLFELAWLGVPVTAIGTLYLAVFGRRLLPDRAMLTSILTAEERREYLTEAFVQPNSPVLGQTLEEAGLTRSRGIKVIEIVRNGIALYHDPIRVQLKAGDRLILSCRPTGIAHTRRIEGVDLISELNLGLEQIAAHEGSLVEAVVTPNSSLNGRSLRELQFRQRYRMVVLAVHRRGENVREQFDTIPLRTGDIVLMMGTDSAIDALAGSDDLMLFDRARVPAKARTHQVALVCGVIAAVVAGAALEWVPIELGALAGCVIVCLLGCLKTSEAYAAIEWNILFLIYGMLAMGLALEKTGAAAWLAAGLVNGVLTVVPAEYQAMFMLGAIYLVTTILTELLSNNAVAALMAPIALGIAAEMGIDPRPLIIAVTFAASAAFATPIGYQTNTYVYGIGGYRFADFLRVGIPLNVLCFVTAMVVIPRVWPF